MVGVSGDSHCILVLTKTAKNKPVVDDITTQITANYDSMNMEGQL